MTEPLLEAFEVGLLLKIALLLTLAKSLMENCVSYEFHFSTLVFNNITGTNE